MTASFVPRREPSWLRVTAFRLLEALSSVRSGAGTSPAGTPGTASSDQRALWVFVSTIGELNAVEPFINRLLDELQRPPLVLVTDRSHYGPSYLAKYPQARVEVIAGTWAHARSLRRRCPPRMLLVAEIPCTLHDAPCRFPYAMVHVARAAGAPVVMVNGWLYGYAPPSRMDAIENRWFARDYVQGYDAMLVQTPGVRSRLLEAGADPRRVVVTGNIKFDAMQPGQAHVPVTPLSSALARRAGGPLIVAGSVTELADQRALLAAHAQVLAAAPGALLVLAPRHPENAAVMKALRELLAASGLDHRLRSEHADPARAADGQVLVLDTMGELRSCYAAADWAYIGTDHNVLEPLAFGKPVWVGPGWDATYPSYPVYRQLMDAGVLHAVDDLAALGPAWCARLRAAAGQDQADRQRLDHVLADARGAVERGLAALREAGLLPAAHHCAPPVPAAAAAAGEPAR